MKLLTFPAFAGVCFAAAINPFDPLVCFDSSPNRIPATSTTSATHSVTSSTKGWATTGGGLVTSYDHNDASSTVWVFPTGPGSREATKIIFEGVQVVKISLVVVVIEVIDSQTVTVVSSDYSSTSIGLTSESASTNLPESTAAVAPTALAESAPKLTSTTSAESTVIKQPSATHLVDVGTGEGFAYTPSQLNASIGDTVRFNFLGKNHSVTQSDLASPCTYNRGFDTGFNQFNPLNISGKFIVDFQVSVSTPLWFYWYVIYGILKD
jgi:plastocyanin